MVKLLVIADLHPEKGKNRDLKNLLRNMLSEGYSLLYLGDCRQYPDHYGDLPHIAIRGNHDSSLKGAPGRTHDFLITDRKLFVHSHQWDDRAEVGGKTTDALWAWFKYSFLSSDLPLRPNHIATTLPHEIVQNAERLTTDERNRLSRQIVPEMDLRFGRSSYDTLIVGHRHTRYAGIVADGVLCINPGAGWKGDFITIEGEGLQTITFHRFTG
jgi:predicted phosphodiesterase